MQSICSSITRKVLDTWRCISLVPRELKLCIAILVTCGRGNIRVSWIFVKSCLIINYVGQGAWLLANYEGKGFDVSQLNAFYGIMPQGFRIIGIVIATVAAIIASQALISGSFTLISEAMRLNLWPKVKIRYPSEERGQVYIRAINFLLFAGCVSVVLYFQRSSRMEGAYGLAITLCMIATSILFANFLVLRRTNPILVYLYLAVYFTIEVSFLIANLEKFPHGGYVASIVGGLLFSPCTSGTGQERSRIAMWSLSGWKPIFQKYKS